MWQDVDGGRSGVGGGFGVQVRLQNLPERSRSLDRRLSRSRRLSRERERRSRERERERCLLGDSNGGYTFLAFCSHNRHTHRHRLPVPFPAAAVQLPAQLPGDGLQVHEVAEAPPGALPVEREPEVERGRGQATARGSHAAHEAS